MFPQTVYVNEENLQKLAETYKAAYAQILSEMEGATNFGTANRKAILRQIQEILKELGTDAQPIIEDLITEAYKNGAQEAVEQLNNVGGAIDVSQGFNKIHKDAILGLVDDTTRAFGEGIQGVNRSASLLLGKSVRDQITQQLATGKIQGAALRDIKKNVVATLQADGLDALVDRGGRGWSLDRYSEMLIRTKSVEARNRGLANRVVENGYDLVQVSSHGAIDVCGKWEGRILSSTGNTPGYPTVMQAETDGLFHPNCRHAINVLIPELALKTKAYDTASGQYLEGPQKQLDKKLAKAVKYNPTFKSKVTSIAESNDWGRKMGSVKDSERAMEKVLRDYGLNVNALKDTNRSLLFVTDPYHSEPIISEIEKEFTVVRVKNDFLKDTEGYKKIIVNVKTPAGIGEIQVTTPEYWEARTELGGHELYNKVRDQVDDFEKFEKQMKKLYDDAESALLNRLNSS